MQKTQNIEEDETGKIGTGQTLIQTVIIYEILPYSPVWSPVLSLSHHLQSILYPVIPRVIFLKHHLVNVTCLL